MDVFFEWIDECLAEDDVLNAPAGPDPEKEERMRQRIRNPAPRHLRQMGRAYRAEQGWSRKEWRVQRRAVLSGFRQDCRNLTDADIDALLDEQAEVDDA